MDCASASPRNTPTHGLCIPQHALLRIPAATYRIQFNAGFTFADAREIVPYLAELGISDIYASPILKARKGSRHGYDVVDANALNPELGIGRRFQRAARRVATAATSDCSSTSSRITWRPVRRTRGG